MRETSDSELRRIIGSMESGQFEQFISDLLPEIDERYLDFEPSFNMLGKTTKGKSDALIYHSKSDT